MSCLDVMYHHQSYGAHCLPAAYKAAYYHHHQQQRKLSVYSKMQEQQQQQQQQRGGVLLPGEQRGGVLLPGEQGLRPRAPEPLGSQSASSSAKDSNQPAEAEYLSSRCVLFTYFQGDIGDVVDQHFSRALSQAFGGDSKPFRGANQPHASPPATGVWKDGVSVSESQSGSVWNGSYQSQSSPCLPAVSFSPSPVPFHTPDGALWAGHGLAPPPASLPDAWAYAQGTGGYPHVHDVYPHSHRRAHAVPARHNAHPTMLHSYPAHRGHAPLDPRFSPLLLPGVRSQSQPAAPSPGGHGDPHGQGIKTEMEPSGSSPIRGTSTAWPPGPLHGPLEVYDSAVDQDKTKATAWF